MPPRETENNAYTKLWDHNKEHYGMLWYFLEWSIGMDMLWFKFFLGLKYIKPV